MRWLPFVYCYAVGWVVFIIGTNLAIKSKNLNLQTVSGRRNFYLLLGGMILFLAIQAFLQFVAHLI